MIRSAYHKTLFALYQLTVTVGILLMPFAVAARKAGVPMPLHRLVERLGTAHERAAT